MFFKSAFGSLSSHEKIGFFSLLHQVIFLPHRITSFMARGTQRKHVARGFCCESLSLSLHLMGQPPFLFCVPHHIAPPLHPASRLRNYPSRCSSCLGECLKGYVFPRPVGFSPRAQPFQTRQNLDCTKLQQKAKVTKSMSEWGKIVLFTQ